MNKSFKLTDDCDMNAAPVRVTVAPLSLSYRLTVAALVALTVFCVLAAVL